MNRFSHIERELLQINEARFQVICNAYVNRQYKGDLHTPGSVIGKEKTRKGRPDAYLILEDGNYILGEYTTRDNTDATKFNKKLDDDLESCLNFESLGIPASKVSKILLCCNSNVDLAQVEKLQQRGQADNIPVRVVGIYPLANWLSQDGRAYAREYLGVAYTSGQILSKEDFIKIYSKKNLATPLDNIFFGKEKELEELNSLFGQNNTTLIKGKPGTGKTKLAIEAIDVFTKQHPEYIPYYVFQKAGSIIEDLVTAFDPSKKYILLIDDANRQINNLLSIIYTQLEKDNGIIKLVLTVRDYAATDIRNAIGNSKLAEFTAKKLDADIIRAILVNPPFILTNRQIIDRIIVIADGNPRLAIMAAKIVLEKPDIDTLNDVSSIYDEYFGTFIQDKQLLADKQILKLLGIIAFFDVIDVEIGQEKQIINEFGIAHDWYADTIELLENAELIDVFMRTSVKISEQVLSNYFFYITCFRDNILPFKLILTKYLEKHSGRLSEVFNACNEAFGPSKVFEKVKADLTDHWNMIKDTDEAVMFVDIFAPYLPLISFLHIDKRINEIPLKEMAEINYQQEIKKSSNSYHDHIFKTLEHFYNSETEHPRQMALDLTIKYVAKNYQRLPQFFTTITKEYSIEENDIALAFKRQQFLYNYFDKRAVNNPLIKTLFYNIFSVLFIRPNYSSSFFIKTDGKWELLHGIQQLRQLFWNKLVSDFGQDNTICLQLLYDYLGNMQYSNATVLLFDTTYLLQIIDQWFEEAAFADAYYAHEYVKNLHTYGITSSGLLSLKEKYNPFSYKVYKALNWDRASRLELRNEVKDWASIDQRRQALISGDLPIDSPGDFEKIIEALNEITRFKYGSGIEINSGLDLLIGALIAENNELGLTIIELYLKSGNKSGLWPINLLHAAFRVNEPYHRLLYMMLRTIPFNEVQIWLERYFAFIPDEYINSEIITDLKEFYLNRQGPVDMNAEKLDKYIDFLPDIYVLVLTAYVQKTKDNTGFIYKTDYHFLKKRKDIVSQHYQLAKEIFFQQEDRMNFDDDGEEFFALFEYDNGILAEYIDYIIEKYKASFSLPLKHLVKLWEYAGAEQLVYDAIVKLKGKSSLYFDDKAISAFFINLKEANKQNAFNVLNRLMQDHLEDAHTLNIAFYFCRNYVQEFYPAFIQYFMSIDDKGKIFDKIEWNNNHFSSNGNEIWSDHKALELQKVYEIVAAMPESFNYLHQLNNLEWQISNERRQSEWERKMRFRGF